VIQLIRFAVVNTGMLESPPAGTEPEVTLGVRAALLEAECIDLRARIEAREQRIRLLEEALRVLKANTYGPSRERLSVAAGQVELFNEIEATLDITEAVGIEPELKATPMREENGRRCGRSTGRPGDRPIRATPEFNGSCHSLMAAFGVAKTEEQRG